MIFWFSGTGNSLWLAQRLHEATGETLIPMGEAMTRGDTVYALAEHERIGFVFPIYGWNMPRVVRQFISRLQLSNYKNNYTYFACTCGDDMGTTEAQVARLLASKGWKLGGAYALKMPNTYVCLPGFDVDSLSVAGEKLRQAPAAAERICQMVLEKRRVKHMTLPGRMPWTKTHILGTFFHRFLTDSRRFHAEDTCIGCGKCAAACPLHNITMQDRPSWGADCTMCLSCYHHCPHHAVAYGTATRNKGQYLHHD